MEDPFKWPAYKLAQINGFAKQLDGVGPVDNRPSTN